MPFVSEGVQRALLLGEAQARRARHGQGQAVAQARRTTREGETGRSSLIFLIFNMAGVYIV